MNKKEVFTSEGDDWWNKAMLMHGWPHKWSIYAAGYKEAADRLVLSIERREGMIDFMVYPILHLYRHFLETSMKAGIRDAQKILGVEPRKPKNKDKKRMAESAQGHDLESLWEYLLELILQIHPEMEMAELDETSAVIKAFHHHDLHGDAARYPTSLNGVPSLKTIEEVNLRKLRENMDKAQGGFYQIEGVLDYERDSCSLL